MPRLSTAAAVALALILSLSAGAAPAGRFFLEGDGRIRLVNTKTGAGGVVTYRIPDGTYPAPAHRRINQIFGVPSGETRGMALRLIALLDYVQDRLGGGTIRIVSGYRSPAYNEGLRQRGRLAARTSMHLEGMAADIELAGVSGRRLWEFVRSLNCCGAGYYHTNVVHLDVGPSRFWDETTTGVGLDLGSRNKLILLRTEWDRYRPGEPIRTALGRITDYPIGVHPEARLVQTGREVGFVRLEGASGDCRVIAGRAAAQALTWRVPTRSAVANPARIRITFCQRPAAEMPEQIESNPISIR